MTQDLPRQRTPIDARALAVAVAALTEETRPRPTRAPMIRQAMTVAAFGCAILAGVLSKDRVPFRLEFVTFMGFLGSMAMLISNTMQHRAGRDGSPWRGRFAVFGLVVSSLGVWSGRLSAPWALGAVALGALFGWHHGRLQTIDEQFLWTPDHDDVRYRDAGGTISDLKALAVIAAPYASDAEAVERAAAELVQLGDLREVLAWLPTRPEQPGRIVLDVLSEHERLVLALVLQVRAADVDATSPTPHAPLPPAPPA